jgi:putative ABC transport system permease protein
LEPNFFVVFEPGVLEDAPQTFLYMTRSDDPITTARAQTEAVDRLSNVSIVDLEQVQGTIDRIVGKITLAVRFMALFSIVSGLIVLVGAIATTKFQRIQESTLLRTLGASGKQIRRIIATEYFALGAAAATTGVLLAAVAGWLLTRYAFEISLSTSPLMLALTWLALVALTITIGALNSRGVTTRAPLATLRELSD